jgi:hypothetical protein
MVLTVEKSHLNVNSLYSHLNVNRYGPSTL